MISGRELDENLGGPGDIANEGLWLCGEGDVEFFVVRNVEVEALLYSLKKGGCQGFVALKNGGAAMVSINHHV